MDDKSNILMAYQLLDALFRGDAQHVPENAAALSGWILQNAENGVPDAAVTPLYEPLSKLIARQNAGEAVAMREYNSLRAPLTAFLSGLMEKIKLRIYLQAGLPSPMAFGIRKAVPAETLKGALPDIREDCIRVLLAANPGAAGDAAGKLDVIITVQELYDRARFCFSMDNFDYDRLYLSGKLKSLSVNRNDVSIVLGGSSYAMVGLMENKMPRPAVNLAVNAQDPYFTFLAVENAKKACRKIDTAVIAGGYYFWHTDMSDSPSDYYKSVLTRTNYPVLKNMHHYKGDVLPPLKRAERDPLLERIFDFEHITEKEHNRISAMLAELPYFNDAFNVRPPNGMLRFPFREQSDEINDKAAMARAAAHNGSYNLAHLAGNRRIFEAFLVKMAKRQVRVILLVAPVTRFYRAHSSPELRETTLDMLKQVRAEHPFLFFDLSDSPEFSAGDFQDYDHLNEKGAEKLSNIVAGIV